MPITTIGKIVNEVGFKIDSPTWRNLDKYQKRIAQLKAQLKSLPSNVKVGVGGNVSGRGGGQGRQPRDQQNAHVQAQQKHAKMMTRRADMISARKIRTEGFIGRSNLNTEQAAKFRKEMDKLATEFSAGQLTSREYSASVSQVHSQMSKANREFRSFNQRFKQFRSLLIAGGIGYAGFEAGKQVVQTGQDFEAVESKFLIGTGDAKQAAEGLKFVRDEASRLGLDLLNASDSYARLAVAAKDKLPTTQVKELFTSFSELGTAAGIDPERMKLGARAIEQMLNKGTLMAEEVKSQFSESIPGGLAIFSRALGVTEKEFLKLMETGQLASSEVLPKVAKEMAKMAREGGALEVKMQSNRAAMNRMITAFQDLQNTFFKGGFGALTQKLFDSLRNTMEALMPVANMLGYTLNVAFTTATFPVRFLVAVLSDLFKLLDVTGESSFAKTLAWLTGLTAGFVALRAAAGFAKIALLGLIEPVLAGFTALIGVFGAIPVLIGTAIASAALLIISYWDDIKGMAMEAWHWISSLFGFSGQGIDINQVGATAGRSPAALTAAAARSTTTAKVDVNVSVDDDGKIKAYVQDAASNSMSGLQNDLQSSAVY